MIQHRINVSAPDESQSKTDGLLSFYKSKLFQSTSRNNDSNNKPSKVLRKKKIIKKVKPNDSTNLLADTIQQMISKIRTKRDIPDGDQVPML